MTVTKANSQILITPCYFFIFMDQNNCFVCGTLSKKTIHAKESAMHECKFCGAMWQPELKQEDFYKHIYDENYYKKIWGYSKETDHLVSRSKWYVSKKFIRLLHQYKRGGTVLEVGCGLGYLLSLLQRDSFCYDVYGVEISPFAKKIAEERIGKGRIFQNLEDAKKKKLQFDSILLFDSMEHIPDQDKLLRDIDELLAPEGIVLVIMPSASSWTKKIMGKYWLEYKQDHVIFYSKKSLRQQLAKHGFKIDYLASTWKSVTLYYLISYLSVFRIPAVSYFLSLLKKMLPEFALNTPLSFPVGQMTVVFSKKSILL